MTDNDVNAPEYQAYRREILGTDDNGNLIFGERVPLDEVDGEEE